MVSEEKLVDVENVEEESAQGVVSLCECVEEENVYVGNSGEREESLCEGVGGEENWLPQGSSSVESSSRVGCEGS